MKLYHYAPSENTVLSEGLLSLANSKKDLRCYAHRASSADKQKIFEWLDSTFPGRTKSISCLTEPIKWYGNDPILKKIADASVLFSFELKELAEAGLIEAIWCKDGSSADGHNEKFYQIEVSEIDLSPLSWHKCCVEKGLLYAVIRHYLLVIKDGVIPPKYITQEKQPS